VCAEKKREKGSCAWRGGEERKRKGKGRKRAGVLFPRAERKRKKERGEEKGAV
jgi:hypothetical protein